MSLRSTFFGIEIGKSGIVTSQLGLDVTGHNIANVDTKGYTRQRIVSTAYDPFTNIGRALPVMQARVGGGVRVLIHDQIRSAYLDRRYRTENTANSYWQKRTESLTYVESYFDNVKAETSINYSVANFFEAIKVLSEDSVEGAPRKLLQTSGQDLVQQLNSIYEGLIDLQKIQNQAVDVTVGEINRITAEIVELNKVIYGFEITGSIALDLRDKRNLLLDELSSLIDIEYREVRDIYGGTIMIVETDGRELVNHDNRLTFGVRLVDNTITGEDKVFIPCWLDKYGEMYVAKYDNGNPIYEVDDDDQLILDIEGNPIPVIDSSYDFIPKGGELKAYIDMRDNSGVELSGIPRYIDMLNDLARALVQEINSVHVLGWTDPPGATSKTNVEFFGAKDDTGAYLQIGYWVVAATDVPVDTTYVNEFGQYLDGPAPGGAVIDLFATDASGEPIYKYVTDTSLITAKNICLSQAVKASEFSIACSTVKIVKQGGPEELQRGNNENTNMLYKLFEKSNIRVGTVDIGSFDGFITGLRFDIGNSLSFSKKSADNFNVLTIAAENQRLSIAGVSLDEEMTEMIKYQHAYSGSSRVITAMDEMLDKLINGTGRVGL